MRRVWMLMTVAVLALGSAGCKQGTGERCQIESDCSGDLICCPRTGQNSICPSQADCTGSADSGPLDSGGDVSGPDTTLVDAAGGDLPGADSAAGDSGGSDAGGTDSTADAATE